jgi:hypothetical protein
MTMILSPALRTRRDDRILTVTLSPALRRRLLTRFRALVIALFFLELEVESK